MTRTVRGKNKRTAYEIMTGETPDISEWLDFDFYDWVHYWDNPDDKDSPKIGKWLGVSHRIGSALCYYVLKENGKIVSRTTVQPIPDVELQEPEIMEKREKCKDNIDHILSDESYIIPKTELDYLYISSTHWTQNDEVAVRKIVRCPF